MIVSANKGLLSLDGICLQWFQLMDRSDGIAEGRLDAFNRRMALVRIVGVFGEIQRRFKNVSDIYDRCVGHVRFRCSTTVLRAYYQSG
jgi:hypothetical protein